MEAEHLFFSPQSPEAPQVRSPRASAAQMEGEVAGPNYGTMLEQTRPVMNGVVSTSSVQVEATAAAMEGSLGEGNVPGASSSGSGPGATRVTGLDATTHAGGAEVGSTIREPQGPQTRQLQMQHQQQQHQQLSAQASPHQPPSQSLQALAPLSTPLFQHQQPAATVTSSTTPRAVPLVSSLLSPQPESATSPSQVVRSWTSQVATAAMAMGQRIQLQTALGQSRADMHQGNVGLYEGEALAFEVDGHDRSANFPLRSEAPPLPQHLRSDLSQSSSRAGVLAGLARAGQALRRRVVDPMIQQVARTPVQNPSPSMSPGDDGHCHGSVPLNEGVFPPAVAEAMHEWTTRPSLIAPGPPGALHGRDESSASSLSPELIMEEVRKQVQIAMAEKNNELQDLKKQNDLLRRALQSTQQGGGEGRDQRASAGRSFERPGNEPGLNSAAQGTGDQSLRGDPRLSYERASISGCNPLGAGGPQSVPAGDPGGHPDHGVSDGRRPDNQSPEGHFGPAQRSSVEGEVHMGEPLQLLVQGMRQLQQAYLGKTDSKDAELKGSIEVPTMPDVGPEASVAFADWLYELEQAVGALSDKASIWFAACLEVARQTYVEYSMASPMKRLSLQPRIPEALKEAKWSRLERRVMNLLLGAMKKSAKEDAVTHRIADVPSLLFRLHVLYQPGGISERAAVLKQLEGKPGGEDVHECVASLRKWRRYLERAEAMHVSVPDPSILLAGVDMMVKKVMAAYPEVKFRTDLMRNELQLQGQPTLEGVLRLHTHILAELQMIAPVSSTTPTPTTLKAIGTGQAGTGEATTPSGSPTRRQSGKTPCKFFLSKSGCTKGSTCKFDHTFESKEEKRARCWECGSQQHRRSECPVAIKLGKSPKSPSKADREASSSSATSSAIQVPSSGHQQAILESIQAAPPSSIATLSCPQAASSSTSTSAPSPSDSEVKDLLKEANAMLSKLAKLQALEVRTNVSVGELSAVIQSAGLSLEEGFALLDTGASHAFKTAERADLDKAMPVRVELAGGQYVTLKQTKAGTLLAAAQDEGAPSATPILPLGALVQQLGCELTWTRKGGLKVIHPEFGVLKTFVKGNHPMLAETQALDIIAQLEDFHLQTLEATTAETFVRTLDLGDMKTWDSMLGKFVATGDRASMLDALSLPGSPLGPLPQHVLSLAAVHVDLGNKQGWKYLKALPLNRTARKAMMTKRWVVRLFRREGEADLSISNSEGSIVIDCDVARSKRFTLKGDSAMYKALMWAAARGQIEGIIGNPPANEGLELLTKQLLLWTVARQGAMVARAVNPFLVLGSTPASSMWKSGVWTTFRQEHYAPMMQFESNKDGANYLLATNLAVRGDLLPQESVEIKGNLMEKTWPNVWKPPLLHELGYAIDRWRCQPEELYLGYLLYKLDSDGPWTDRELRHWRQHVANGHTPFDRRCKTCVTTAATGRAHRRVLAPSCYTLSLDVCGPFRIKGEYAGSRGYRYALIGTYVMPKLDAYKDVPIPEEPDFEAEAPDEDGFLEEQGPQDPPLDASDQADLERSNEKFQALYKEIGDVMEYQTLHYAIPLKSRLMPEVDAAVKQVYLQIRAEGLPVTRVHSDRARELRGGDLRSWLLHRDVLPTTGEAQEPQTNGRAEAGVKRAKTRTKTLLKAAGLDRSCWPFAMSFAAFQQREYSLGRSKNVIPFGSPVLVKKKVFGVGGKYDLDDRWEGGVYVGPSSELRQGHVVRFPSGRIVTSLHFRTGVVDSDGLAPLDPLEASFLNPSRRITGKRPLAVHEVRHPTDPPEPPEVSFDHEHQSGEDIAHIEAAGVWTDEEPAVGFLGEGVPQLMTYSLCSDHPEPAEVSFDHEHQSGGFLDQNCVAVSALKPLSEPERRAEELAESYLKAGIMAPVLVLQLFEVLEEVRQLFSRASRRRPRQRASSWATGAFTHGGVSGLRDGSKRLPAVTKFLAKFAREYMGAKQFGAIVLQRNGGGSAHRDFHNLPGSRNWLCPLTSFDGGGLWVQQDPFEKTPNVDGAVVEKEVRPNVHIKGEILEAVKGKSFSFNPRLWHEVQPHSGDRVMLIAYTPRLSNLDDVEADYLKGLGFPLFGEEESAVPEHGPCDKPERHVLQVDDGGQDLVVPFLCLNETHCQLLEDLQDRSRSLRLLLEEEQALAEDLRQTSSLIEREATKTQSFIDTMLQNATKLLSEQDRAVLKLCLKAASDYDEPDYEALLESLEGDLQVVHTVPLAQVKPVVDRWHAAIRKELDNLFQGGTLVEISREEALRLEEQGLLKLVPSKGVHTLKPPAKKDDKYKRKYRLVLCGNFVAPEEEFGSLYAGGASAETLRAVLVFAAHKGWQGATADITGAFLLAPWPDHLQRYAVVPPRLLTDNGYVSSSTFWLVQRPLYGLRESPAIWAAYRSARLSKARILYQNKYLVLRMSSVDPELWLIFYEGEEGLVGCVITYVDDLLYAAASDVVEAVHGWVLEEWPCSQLEWASKNGGTRYLGMEVFQRPTGAYEIHQKGYILDLLRSHGMEGSPGTLLPCPKEWITGEVPSEPEDFTTEELRFGQRMVGEQLWLTMRCRPDLQFVVSHMSQWVAKHPRRVARIAKRVLSYLASTLDLKLILGDYKGRSAASDSSSSTTPANNIASEVVLVGFSDSSFAPYGDRSYGASVVTLNGSPVAWKCGRQGMVTLSTMESELLEATTAVTLLECIGCLIDELCGKRVHRHLRVDNSSATAMLCGGPGSWRTRHLRVRSAFVREQVQSGMLEVSHVEGRWQLADLGTKMHPRARLLDLLYQWGFEGLSAETVQVQMLHVLLMSCVVVALEGVPRASASGSDKASGKDPLASAGMDELLLVSGIVAVAAVLLWEFVKWLFRCFKRSAKKEGKLQRLRELARLTAEEEIERLQTEEVSVREVQEAVRSVLAPTPDVANRQVQETEVLRTPRQEGSHQSRDQQVRSSPGGQSTTSPIDDDVTNTSDRMRLCRDVLSLMTCEALKAGLRVEGLTVSGLKGDQVSRLALKLVPVENFQVPGRSLPSDRQLRYILWLWRHRHLQGRCALTWSDVCTKESASRWIHIWKDN